MTTAGTAGSDAAWRQAVSALDRGVAVAIDYAHTRTSRPLFGSLTGYARGQQTVPIPDGSCDITAHVALDACAAATPADWTVHATQRAALHSLGITGTRPDLAYAVSVVSRFASNPTEGHMKAVKRIF